MTAKSFRDRLFRVGGATGALGSLTLPNLILPLLSGLALTGCAGRQELARSELTDPPRSDSYFVTTNRGEELEFITLKAADDTLSGTLRTTRKRLVGTGDRERMEVQNQYRDIMLPLSSVQRVEIQGTHRTGLLYAIVGAIAAGGAYFVLNKPDDTTTGGTGGGKEPPPPPNP